MRKFTVVSCMLWTRATRLVVASATTVMTPPECHIINYLFHFFLCLASPFSSQCLVLLLKLSRICALLLLLLPFHVTSFVCPSLASGRRWFLRRICPIQLTFIPRILFKSVSSFLTSFFVNFSGYFIFSTLLQHHIFKLFKYLCANFLQVSEPCITLTKFFLKSMFRLLFKTAIFLQNAALAMKFSSCSPLCNKYLIT